MEKDMGNAEQPSRVLLFTTMAFVAVSHSVYSFYTGPLISGDTFRFVDWAESIKSVGIIEMLHAPNTAGNAAINYFSFSLMLYLSKIVLGESWSWGLLVLNLLVELIAAYMVLWLMWHVSQKETRLFGIIGAGFFLIFGFDYFFWTPTMMTDTFFMGAGTLLMGALFFALNGGRKSAPYYWGLTLLLFILAFISRPTWPPFLFVMLFSAIFMRPTSIDTPEKRVTLIKRLVIGSVFVFIIATVSFSYLMMDLALMEKLHLPTVFYSVQTWFHKGIVMIRRPELLHPTPNGPLDIIMIILDRIIHFFAITAQGFRLPRIITQYIYYLPLYGFGLVAVYDLFNVRFPMTKPIWLLAFLSITLIIVYCYFISLLLLDHDWRLRLPIMPELIILAAIGIERVMGRIATRSSRG